MDRTRLTWVTLLGFVLALTSAQAGAELLLTDGERLTGEDVERKETLYLLTMEDGEVISVPVEMVRELRLTGGNDPAPTGMRSTDGETLVGPRKGPHLAKTAEQVAVIGEPREFQQGVIDPTWKPESGWDPNAVGNDFHPVKWYEPPIDTIWQPQSAFGQFGDVTEFSPVRWYRSSFEYVWIPRDGFDRSPDWFPRAVGPATPDR